MIGDRTATLIIGMIFVAMMFICMMVYIKNFFREYRLESRDAARLKDERSDRDRERTAWMAIADDERAKRKEVEKAAKKKDDEIARLTSEVQMLKDLLETNEKMRKEIQK